MRLTDSMPWIVIVVVPHLTVSGANPARLVTLMILIDILIKIYFYGFYSTVTVATNKRSFMFTYENFNQLLYTNSPCKAQRFEPRRH